MTAPPVSVVVVSRDRPELLSRCLTGLGQLCYPILEIVVVADPAGMAAAIAHPLGDQAKTVPFDAPNISAARNRGIEAASGAIVAFIDDDAVPEPTWLDNLTGPFTDPDVAATGGFVIGRNGISIQWGARGVNARGLKVQLEHAGSDPFEPAPPVGYATKTEGTNFAVRRDLLAALGGFDPAFRFYLDETDLNMRLAARGARTVLVPRALVHHGFAASARRAVDRAPTDLTEIGASSAVFLRKHAPDTDMAAELSRITDDHRRALLGYMVHGALEPREVNRRLAELHAGFREGLRRDLAPPAPIAPSGQPFRKLAAKPPEARSRHFAGRPWNRRALASRASASVASGDIVTVFRFSPTALPHRVRFDERGWWEQRGGLFGRSERDGPYFRWTSFQRRVAKEWQRVASVRQCQKDDIKS